MKPPVVEGKPMPWNRIPVLFLVMGILYLVYWASKRREFPYGRRIAARPVFAAALTILLLTTIITGCSGLVAQNAKSTNTNGTPAGTYTLVVTATSGNLTHVTNLTLVVN
jgi:hypothetical protein